MSNLEKAQNKQYTWKDGDHEADRNKTQLVIRLKKISSVYPVLHSVCDLWLKLPGNVISEIFDSSFMQQYLSCSPR
mgnify:CR=1 FL=1